MEPIEIPKYNQRLNIYEQRIEKHKQDYAKYSNDAIAKAIEYEQLAAKKELKWKSDGHPDYPEIKKPTEKDIERFGRLDDELEAKRVEMLVSKTLKDVVDKEYKMTETQISTIQTRIGYLKKELEIQR